MATTTPPSSPSRSPSATRYSRPAKRSNACRRPARERLPTISNRANGTCASPLSSLGGNQARKGSNAVFDKAAWAGSSANDAGTGSSSPGWKACSRNWASICPPPSSFRASLSLSTFNRRNCRSHCSSHRRSAGYCPDTATSSGCTRYTEACCASCTSTRSNTRPCSWPENANWSSSSLMPSPAASRHRAACKSVRACSSACCSTVSSTRRVLRPSSSSCSCCCNRTDSTCLWTGSRTRTR